MEKLRFWREVVKCFFRLFWVCFKSFNLVVRVLFISFYFMFIFKKIEFRDSVEMVIGLVENIGNKRVCFFVIVIF